MSLTAAAVVAVLLAAAARPGAAQPPAELAAAFARRVDVATDAELAAALAAADADTAVVVAAGAALQLPGGGVEMRAGALVGAAGGAARPELRGGGAAGVGVCLVLFAPRAVVAHVRLRGCRLHAIQAPPGAAEVRVHAVDTLDTQQVAVKIDGDGSVDVTHSDFRWSAGGAPLFGGERCSVGALTAPSASVVFAHNTVENQFCSTDILPDQPVVLVRASSGPIELMHNRFVNITRGPSLGLSTGSLVSDVFVGNNLIVHTEETDEHDVGLYLAGVQGGLVCHNTIWVREKFGSAIDVRYDTTQDLVIESNVLDGRIKQRNGAEFEERNNGPDPEPVPIAEDRRCRERLGIADGTGPLATGVLPVSVMRTTPRPDRSGATERPTPSPLAESSTPAPATSSVPLIAGLVAGGVLLVCCVVALAVWRRPSNANETAELASVAAVEPTAEPDSASVTTDGASEYGRLAFSTASSGNGPREGNVAGLSDVYGHGDMEGGAAI